MVFCLTFSFSHADICVYKLFCNAQCCLHLLVASHKSQIHVILWITWLMEIVYQSSWPMSYIYPWSIWLTNPSAIHSLRLINFACVGAFSVIEFTCFGGDGGGTLYHFNLVKSCQSMRNIWMRLPFGNTKILNCHLLQPISLQLKYKTIWLKCNIQNWSMEFLG